jgi:hypothetical protein
MNADSNVLSRIEQKLDNIAREASDMRERLARGEEWRQGHTQDHQQDTTRQHWTIGLLLTTLVTSLTTAAIVLFH